VSLLEQVTAPVHFAHFEPHRGSAAAPEEVVTGRQAEETGSPDKLSRRILRLTRKAARIYLKRQADNKCRENPEISYPVSNEEDSNYSDKSDDLALIRDVDQLKGPAVPGLREIIPSRSYYRTLVSYRSYRLFDRSQRYDPSVKAKLAVLLSGSNTRSKTNSAARSRLKFSSSYRSSKKPPIIIA
jgi:hypothetical protein